MQTVQLDKKRHNRKAFDCEVNALNNYLHSMASQHSLKDNTRTVGYHFNAPIISLQQSTHINLPIYIIQITNFITFIE